eukprot:1303332-Amphidinium_carterae.1
MVSLPFHDGWEPHSPRTIMNSESLSVGLLGFATRYPSKFHKVAEPSQDLDGHCALRAHPHCWPHEQQGSRLCAL